MYVEITKVRLKNNIPLPPSEIPTHSKTRTAAYASCDKAPQVLSGLDIDYGTTRASIDKRVKFDHIISYDYSLYHIDKVLGTYLVDVSDDGQSMRLVCSPGILNDDVNLSSERVYAYNEDDGSVVSVWESDEQNGWYFERYGLQSDGTFASVDGGLFDFERDDNGDIVEGYKSALETYFEVAKKDGDMFCGPDMFELVFNAYCCASSTAYIMNRHDAYKIYSAVPNLENNQF